MHEQLEAAREPGEWIEGYDDDRPHLNPYERWLFAQFHTLHSQRPAAFGDVPAAIPVAEMRAQWEWLALGDVCPPAEFQRYMILMDRILRTFYAEQVEARDAESKPKD